jgi:hypothetical protein
VHFLDINGDDPSVADKVEEGGEEVGRSPPIRAAFDEERRSDLTEGLLDRPQVQDVLPDGLPQPRLVTEVIRLPDEASEELFIAVPAHEANEELLIEITS